MLLATLTTLGALLGCGALLAGRRHTAPSLIPVRVRSRRRHGG